MGLFSLVKSLGFCSGIGVLFLLFHVSLVSFTTIISYPKCSCICYPPPVSIPLFTFPVWPSSFSIVIIQSLVSPVISSPSVWRFCSSSGDVVIGRYPSLSEVSWFSKSISSCSISPSSPSVSVSEFFSALFWVAVDSSQAVSLFRSYCICNLRCTLCFCFLQKYDWFRNKFSVYCFPVSVVTVCSVPLTAVCSFLWHLPSNELLLRFFSKNLKGLLLTELFCFGDFSVIAFSSAFVRIMTIWIDTSPSLLRDTYSGIFGLLSAEADNSDHLDRKSLPFFYRICKFGSRFSAVM